MIYTIIYTYIFYFFLAHLSTSIYLSRKLFALYYPVVVFAGHARFRIALTIGSTRLPYALCMTACSSSWGAPWSLRLYQLLRYLYCYIFIVIIIIAQRTMFKLAIVCNDGSQQSIEISKSKVILSIFYHHYYPVVISNNKNK